jgi:hypothetical protein
MHETENYYDQEIDFTYEGKDYIWCGDYTIETYGEDESEYAPAYGEVEVKIDHTSSLASYEDGMDMTPTDSMIEAIKEEILNNL